MVLVAVDATVAVGVDVPVAVIASEVAIAVTLVATGSLGTRNERPAVADVVDVVGVATGVCPRGVGYNKGVGHRGAGVACNRYSVGHPVCEYGGTRPSHGSTIAVPVRCKTRVRGRGARPSRTLSDPHVRY